MRAARRLLVVAGLAGIVALWPAAAAAHPLGNFTVNVASRLEVSPDQIRVGYVVDMAEIPTQQAKPDIDADGDGAMSGSELDAWARRTAAVIGSKVALSVDGAEVPLRLECAAARLAPGQADLPVLRLEAAFSGPAPPAGAATYRDGNYEDRLGWHEVTAAGVDGVVLETSSVPTRSASDGLRSYPRDLLSSPPDVRTASFSYRPGASQAAASAPCAGSAAAAPARAPGGFAGLATRSNLSPWAVAVSMALALGFGALHALGPGHGKTLMAAYLVGAGGRARQAIAIGAAVAVMHTASVLGLGLLVLSLERTFRPERVYPWLGLASGLVALALGAGLLVSRLAAWGNERRAVRAIGDGHRHVNGGDQSDPHVNGGDRSHPHVNGGHHHAMPHEPVLSRKGLMALAVAGGILPSPTALVVLLSAVSFDRAGFGLALVGMFSVGLAGALISVGLLALRARDAVSGRLTSAVTRLVPVISAAAIVVVGVVLTLRGVAQL
jgi:nickel/cobalt exporter